MGFAGPEHKGTQENDPVMGGESTGTFTIENELGVFDGEVVDVPYLQAPGFIKVVSSALQGFSDVYPSIASCEALTITSMATEAYSGYRVSFSNAHPLDGKTF